GGSLLDQSGTPVATGIAQLIGGKTVQMKGKGTRREILERLKKRPVDVFCVPAKIKEGGVKPVGAAKGSLLVAGDHIPASELQPLGGFQHPLVAHCMNAEYINV